MVYYIYIWIFLTQSILLNQLESDRKECFISNLLCGENTKNYPNQDTQTR